MRTGAYSAPSSTPRSSWPVATVVDDAGTTFSYSGTSIDPSSVGTTTIAHGPDGRPLQTTSSAGTRLVVGNRHRDVAATPALDGTIASSSVHDPQRRGGARGRLDVSYPSRRLVAHPFDDQPLR